MDFWGFVINANSEENPNSEIYVKWLLFVHETKRSEDPHMGGQLPWRP